MNDGVGGGGELRVLQWAVILWTNDQFRFARLGVTMWCAVIVELSRIAFVGIILVGAWGVGEEVR